MPFDRVRETSTTTGTGPLTLAGAPTGFRAFGSVYTPSDTIYYAIVAVDGSGVPTGDWEIGAGVLDAGTLLRDSVSASSNANALVSFAAGTKQVFDSLSVQAVSALSSEMAATIVANAIAGHVLDADPHGDRAYAAGLVAALDAAAVGAAPASHASQHQHGGADEVATATAAPNAIPKAGPTGVLDPLWLAAAWFDVDLPGDSDYYGLPAAVIPALSSSTITPTANQLWGNIFTAYARVMITHAYVFVSGAGSAGSVGVVTLYAGTYDPITGSFTTGAKVADLGTLALDGATGVRTISGLSQVIEKGMAYYIGISVSAACTISCGHFQRLTNRWMGGATNLRVSTNEFATGAYPPPDPGPTLSTTVAAQVFARAPVLMRWTAP